VMYSWNSFGSSNVVKRRWTLIICFLGSIGATWIYGESLAPIRQSLRELAKSAPQGKLRGVVDFGNLPPENYDVSDMIVEVFQGMAIKSGFADAKVYGCWYRKPHDWELPEQSFVEMPEYETVVPVGEARIYPVATTLSRYLTDADLYIEIIFQNADADRLISDEQLPELRAAIDRLNLASKQYARVSAYYGKDIAPDGGTELAIAKHQDADFYQSLIDVLKDAGFENVALCIAAGGSAICNDY